MVSKAQILADIAALALPDVVDSDSSVLVFFSGHGAVDVDGITKIIPTRMRFRSRRPNSALNWTPFPAATASSSWTPATRAASSRTREPWTRRPRTTGVYDDGTGGSALLAALGSYSELLAAAFESYDPYTPMVVTAAGSEELSWESRPSWLPR